jgi:hypothetical protein
MAIERTNEIWVPKELKEEGQGQTCNAIPGKERGDQRPFFAGLLCFFMQEWYPLTDALPNIRDKKHSQSSRKPIVDFSYHNRNKNHFPAYS